MRIPEWRFGDPRLAASLVLVGAACFVFAPERPAGGEPVPESPAAAVPVLVDHGLTGYAEAGAWNTHGAGHGGSLRWAPPGVGRCTAAWTVPAHDPGDYLVRATWTGTPDHATDATYRIFDGETLLAAVAIDQRVEPGGEPIGGVPFQVLATVRVGAGPLRVVLTDAADGNVVADAVAVAVPPERLPTVAEVHAAADADPERWADAGRLGARPGTDLATAGRNGRALQAIVDALATYPGPRRLRLAREYTIDRMLDLAADRLEVSGPPGGGLRMHPSRSDGLLFLGRLRRPKLPGGPPEGAHVDPSSVVDLTPIGLPGRWGIRTGPAFIADPDGPLAHPNCPDGFTVDMLLDTTDHPLPVNGPLCGMWRRNFAVGLSNDALVVLVPVPAGTPEGVDLYRCDAPKPARRGPVQITVQVDMTTGRGLVLYDRAVAFAGAMRRWGGGEAIDLPPGRKIPPNDWRTFHLGLEGVSSFGGSVTGQSDPPRERLWCGFHLSRGPVYKEDGSRLDGREPTWERSFFTVGPGTVGLLELRADHAALDATRRVEIVTPGPRHSAYLFDPASGNPWNVQGGYKVEGLSLAGSDQPYGSTVVVPNCLYSAVRRCSIDGNRRAVAGWGYSATYTLDVEECWMSAHDVAVHLTYAIANLRRNKVGYVGRAAAELVESRTEIDDLFVMPIGKPQYVVRVEGGGQLLARNVVSDWEGREAPTVAGFRFDGAGSFGPSYRLESCQFGYLPPGVPMVWATVPEGSRADLGITQMDWAYDAGEVVRCSGPVLIECDGGTTDRARRRARPIPVPVLPR